MLGALQSRGVPFSKQDYAESSEDEHRLLPLKCSPGLISRSSTTVLI